MVVQMIDVTVAIVPSKFSFFNVSFIIHLIQVDLMRLQLRRAKARSDTQDIELAMDIMVVFSKEEDRSVDSAILERLANKLELHTIADLKAESVAVKKLVKERGMKNPENIRQIMDLLEKLKQIAGIDENVALDGPISSKSLRKNKSLLVPNEFLCPIALEIMVDPVIVATGQVILHSTTAAAQFLLDLC